MEKRGNTGGDAGEVGRREGKTAGEQHLRSREGHQVHSREADQGRDPHVHMGLGAVGLSLHYHLDAVPHVT